MMRGAVGVDGCRGGWLAVEWNKPAEATVFATAAELWAAHAGAERMLIDVPIGLTDATRACDLAAKAVLGRWNSRVFLTPPRAVLGASDYAEANLACRAARGAGLSKQTWFIVPKIREMDELLCSSPQARGRVRECHPEICFAALAGEVIAENKATDAGYARRIAALGRVMDDPAVCVQLVSQRCGRAVVRDDIVDALVAAWAAAGSEAELRVLPSRAGAAERGERDGLGLRVEMVYRTTIAGFPGSDLPARSNPRSVSSRRS